MKITRLNLKKYLRFHDIDLHFIYPENHPKAGLPMEKVCFIGQSGTGKTNILRLIHYLLADVIEDAFNKGKKGFYNDFYRGNNFYLLTDDEIEFELHFDELMDKNTEKCSIRGNKEKGTCNCTFSLKSDRSECRNILNKFIEFRKNEPNKMVTLVHFEAERSFNPNFFNSYLSDNDKKDPQQNFIAYLDQYQSDLIANAVSEKYRKHLAQDIEFKTEISDLSVKFFNIKTDGEERNLKKKIENYREWKNENPSPLEEFAKNYLDPVLELFGLKTKTELDNDTLQNLQAIHLEQSDGTYLPNVGWSLGTRNLVYATLPLYMLDLYKSIVLMDEPETSLYPDVQKQLVDLYTKQLNEDCENQYFFATHSPMFAAEFDPCERFIFSFDECGNVKVRKGSTAEGNVPDELLEKDFKIQLLGTEGLKNWNRLNDIVKDLYYLNLPHDDENSLKNNTMCNDLIQEYLQIAHYYNFPVPEEYNEKHKQK